MAIGALCGGLTYPAGDEENALYWEHNYYNDVRYRVASEGVIPAGHHVLLAEIEVDEEGKFGTGGTVTLRVDNVTVGTGRFEQHVAGYFTVNETFDARRVC
ncbi:hypothetical protein C8J98_102257 [Luteibacter sp. OK325]|uniref:hypothetical protein n=1 Tax=Luteibacter sp. OK325 TaxID=2135670 RepID=UPI000D36706B|nr:hypothetical protein [Luteibacter sp. OK325]PTR34069.1 hypothetical protein C8J98_102257 [Luteibacter sp. OK325]